MLGTLIARLQAEGAPRALLWLNHVMLSEPAACARLLPHQGKSLQIQALGLPTWMGPVPVFPCRITPAGLFEAIEPEAAPTADLVVTLDLSSPLQLARQALQGGRPDMHLQGDSALAGELDWLSRNLRWDLADDLQRWIGPGPAQAVAQAGGQVAEWLRQLARSGPGPYR